MSYHPPEQPWPGAHSDVHPVAGFTPHKPHRLWPYIFGVPVLIAIGCMVLAVLSLGGPETSPHGVVQVPTTIAPPASSGGPTHTPSHRPVSISDGTWEVGVDIPAGKFKTEGAEERAVMVCYWDVRTKSETGNFVAQGIINGANEPGRVTLRKGQFFHTSGCKGWNPV